MQLKKTFRDPTICVLAALIVGTSVAFLLTAIRGVPAPRVHDEFAYLLAADTFASGRVTNPTHPMWQHFETFHVIQQPTYNAKYQPAQALTLAVGQWLGHPIIGACLSTGLAVGCLVWMLTGWIPRKYFWILVPFAAFHPGLQIVWGQSYWGGNIALAGASLLLGALGRLTSKMEIRYALIAALGTVLLANSRPFEGAILTICVGLTLIWKYFQFPSWKLKAFLVRVLLPGFAVLGIAAAGTLAYNSAVTGNPFKMPYQIHEATYGWTPLFLWEQAGPRPDYRHPMIERFYETDKSIIDEKFQTVADVLRIKTASAYNMLKFLCGGTIILAMLGLPWVVRRPKHRLVIYLATPTFLASLATPWAWEHYSAPAAPLLILLFVWSLIELWKRSKAKPTLRLASLLMVLVCHLIWCVSTWNTYGKIHADSWANGRVSIQQDLIAQAGRDLVLVRYADNHNPNAEWVYNESDIDRAEVVWAREISDDRRKELLDYFSDRNVWIVEPDFCPPQVRRYHSNDAENKHAEVSNK